MEDSPNIVVRIVIGLVLTLLVGAFAFFIFRTVKSTGDDVTNQVTAKMTAALEAQYTAYEGTTVTGSEVINLINDTYAGQEPIYITVCTNLDAGGKTYCYSTALAKISSTTESTLVQSAKDKSKDEYITPNGQFVGTVVRNDNNAIVGLKFTQK